MKKAWVTCFRSRLLVNGIQKYIFTQNYCLKLIICDIGFVCCVSSSDWMSQVCRLREIIFRFVDKMCITWLWHLMDKVFSFIHTIFRMLVESEFLVVCSWSHILGLSQCLESCDVLLAVTTHFYPWILQWDLWRWYLFSCDRHIW